MKQAPIILSFLLALLFISSCEETEEACLDLLAENLSFTAVNPCDDCCTYPSLTVNFSLINDTLAYNLGDSLVLVTGDTVILDRFKLLLSDFSFGNADTSYNTRDTVLDVDFDLRDDFVLIQNEGNQTVGTTRFSDDLDYCAFTSGFDELRIDDLMPFENLDQDSNLDLALDSMYIETDEIYLSAFFSLLFTRDSSIVDLAVPNEAFGQLEYVIDNSVNPGDDWSVNLSLDMKILLQGVEQDMDEEVILETIISNYLSSLVLE